MSALSRWGIVLFAAIVSVLPRFSYLNVPFERDEGVYAYIADTISRGGVPYLDAFDNKSPGVYYLYNVAFKIFGHGVAAPRILAALFVLAGCLLAFRIVYRLTQSFSGGVIAMAFLGLATASPAYTGFNANTEIFTVPLILGALLLLLGSQCVDEPLAASPPLQKGGQGGFAFSYLFAGLLFGCALMVKQSVLPIAVFAFLGSVPGMIRNVRKLVVRTALYAVGGALPFLLFALYFKTAGAFAEFWSGFLLFNIGYASMHSEHLGWPRFLAAMSTFLRLDPMTWLAGIAGGAIFSVRSRTAGRWIFLATVVGAALSVSMGKYFFTHYFIFIVPLLAIGAGAGAGALETAGLRKQALAIAGCLLAVSLFIQAPYFMMSSEEVLQAGYGSGLFAQTAALGRYLKAQAGERTAYTIGAEPELLFYGGLTSPTRFFYSHTIMVPAVATSAYRKEALASIERAKPHYLIVVRNPDAHFPLAENPDEFYDPLDRMMADYQLTALNLMHDDKVYSAADIKSQKDLLARPDAILVFERSVPNPDESLLFKTVEKRK